MGNFKWGVLVLSMAALVPAASGWDDDDAWGMSKESPVKHKPATIQVRVCNNSRDVALVAISYIPVGENRFYNRGWFTVRPGDCNQLVETSNRNFYGYADVVGKDRAWSGDHTLCVQYPGPYNFYTSGSRYCEDDQETRDFQALTATGAGQYTWNLNP